MVNRNLEAISKRLNTQDNRSTRNPMFCVQELKREYGYNPEWVTDTVWFCDGDIVPEETPGATESGYKDRWQTVMVAFTKEGCEEYLRLNGHNMDETRIYAESFHGCPEMIAVREALLGATY